MKTNTVNKKIKNILFMAFTLCIALLTSCSKDDDDIGKGETDGKLTITSIEPASVRVYEEFTINGTGFSTEATANQIYFSTHLEDNAPERPKGVYVSHTTTSITVAVPLDLKYFKDGPITVRVGNQTVVSEQDFVLDETLGYPRLESLSVNHGVPGSEVTILGDSFGGPNYNTDITDLTVLFGDQEAEVISVGGNNARGSEIKVKIPSGVEGNVQVTVQREDFVSQTSLDFTVDPIPASVKATYLINEDGIVKGEVTESGLQFTTIYANNINFVNGGNRMSIDAVNGYLYWMSSNDIVRAPIDGSGTPESVAQVTTFLSAYQVDFTNNVLYYGELLGDWVNGAISKKDLSTGTVTTIYNTANAYPENIMLDLETGDMYWASSGTATFYFDEFKKGNINGGATSTVINKTTLGLEDDLVTYAVYEPSTKEIVFVTQNSSTSNKLHKTSVQTGTNSVLLTGNDPTDIGTDGLLYNTSGLNVDVETGYIYFMDIYNLKARPSTNAIRRVPINGGDVEVLFPDLVGNTFALEIF